MRICYIADAGSIHTQRWVKYFVDNGHEVHLISPRPFGDNNIEDVKLYVPKKVRPQIRIVSGMINLLLYAIRLRRLLKSVKPDILHAHYISEYALSGALSGFHPFILSAWGSDVLIAPKKSKITRLVVKFALRRADLITCDAEHIKAPLVELGVNPAKINLINFGIDVQKFSPGPKDEELIRKLEISDSPVIISLRNLEPFYDIGSLINAVPLVLKGVPEAKFLIAGKGSQEAKLRDLAKSLGIDGSIRFVGFIPNDELPRYLRVADVYISTSLSDAGIAASAAEAMACELPVVITDFGDNRKWVEDGGNGFLVPLRNPEVLASRILTLLSDKEKRIKFGQVGRRVIEERMNVEKEMQRMEMLYEQLRRRSGK